MATRLNNSRGKVIDIWILGPDCDNFGSAPIDPKEDPLRCYLESGRHSRGYVIEVPSGIYYSIYNVVGRMPTIYEIKEELERRGLKPNKPAGSPSKGILTIDEFAMKYSGELRRLEFHPDSPEADPMVCKFASLGSDSIRADRVRIPREYKHLFEGSGMNARASAIEIVKVHKKRHNSQDKKAS